MHAAIVQGAGQTPVYARIAAPRTAPGEHHIRVTAAALSEVSRARASGAHYSSGTLFPFVAGIDGVGRLDDGTRVYFALPTAPNGSMAEVTVVPAARCVPLPDVLDDITAAAIANPGLSSWVALTERAKLCAGETVLVNGATGISGRLAVQIAKHLGAGRVIATGRDGAALAQLAALGADETIALAGDADALALRFKRAFAAGVDVVLDYLWGDSAEALLTAAAKAGADTVPIRFVQIGSVSAATLTLPSAVLRASAITLMGSGLGSVPFDRMIAVTGDLLRAAVPAGLKIATRSLPLTEVEAAWQSADRRQRLVFTP